ncbi:MAG: IS1634 family transposase [Deltaproteobacteria bacterium]|jgi:transposase|nr:IS1634 family transposase [Deltaproteobacteria bacterium]
MATLQKRKSRGHTYWSIVESRRVNGKPRPVILEYLGTAQALLKRLTEGVPKKVRSYTHGDIAVMLGIAEEFKIVETINKHLKSKPFRDGFTVGGSLLLAAIGRICQPTSKRNWYEGWARHTSLSHLIRMSLKRLDSQHFWDQMDALPTHTIPLIEEEIVTNLLQKEQIALDTLLCDTTNFFTYIDSANHRCTIAQRGKNKQKRMDLRQFGLLLLVSRKDQIPIVHKVYQGNLADQSVFKEEFKNILNRFKAICGSLEDITLVFDQGNNSKKMLKNVDDEIHFVGALSPYQHKALIEEANDSMTSVSINGRDVLCYNARKEIWGLDFTVVVYISEKLLQGQIRGIEQNIKKLFKKFFELKERIAIPTKRGKKRTPAGLEKKISSMIGSLTGKDIIRWQLNHLEKDAFDLQFWVDQEKFNFLKQHWLGRRIVITNRHQWTTEEIISAYWGQANVENAFKKMKNPFHLAIRPQYHWTDQKIEVHGFICLLAFLMVMIAYKRAKEKVGFKGSTHTLLEKLSDIRLATFIESPVKKTKGRYKANYRLEEMDPDIFELAEAMNVTDLKLKSNIPFSVYN